MGVMKGAIWPGLFRARPRRVLFLSTGEKVLFQKGGKVPFEEFVRKSELTFEDGALLEFNLLSPQECAELERRSDDASWRHPSVETSLVNLGACMVSSDKGWRPHVVALIDFARGSGPLFGDGSGVESFRSWAYAADAAMLAIRLQECINGKRGPETLRSLERVDKLELRLSKRASAISIFSLCFYTVRRDDPMLAQLPLVRRTLGDGTYLYAFVSVGAPHGMRDDEKPTRIVCSVIETSSELSRSEFGALATLLELEGHAQEKVAERLDITEEVCFADEEVEVLPDEPFSKEDLPAFEALVQAMTAVHLGSVKIDLFQGDQTTGFFSFDSLHSWLWYDFVRDGNVAAIGYCEECGRPFSLVKHRGIERRYCSEVCKTNAKNNRNKERRDRARALFSEGRSVEEISRVIYGSDRSGIHRIRADLSAWVQLKHDLEEELLSGSMELYARCEKEHLDLGKMLSVKVAGKMRGLAK